MLAGPALSAVRGVPALHDLHLPALLLISRGESTDYLAASGSEGCSAVLTHSYWAVSWHMLKHLLQAFHLRMGPGTDLCQHLLPPSVHVESVFDIILC